MSDSDRSNLPTILTQARSGLSERLRRVLGEANLNESQWQVLRYIEQAPQINLEQLKKQAGALADNLNPILNALLKAGLVEYRDTADGKDKDIVLTARGRFLLQRINPKVAFLYHQIENQKDNPAIKGAVQAIGEFFRKRG